MAAINTTTAAADLLLGFGNKTDMANETAAPEPALHYAGAAELQVFNTWYKEIHGFLAVIVCVFGIIANILNIVVLTRKNMISATNCILTGLAVSDGLTMVAYLPFALRFYCLYGTEPNPERNTLSAVRFMLFYACFSVVVHTVSIWLTVTLAVFRYIFIKYPRHGSQLCSLWRAKLAVLLVFLVTLIVCIPNFITLTVQGHLYDNGNSSSTEYLWIVSFKLDTDRDTIIYNFNFWVQAILVKLVPCIGLTILSILLVHTMNEAEQRRQNLRNKGKKTTAVTTRREKKKVCTCFTRLCSSQSRSYGGVKNGEVTGTTGQAANGISRKDDSSRDRKTNRTTRMLLAVVGLFLLTEFPQGILNLLSGILPHFVEEVYGPLGDLVDILALINNGINFILYCTMSKQFRDTFIEVFVAPLKRKTTAATNHANFQPVPTSTNVHENTVQQHTHHTDL